MVVYDEARREEEFNTSNENIFIEQVGIFCHADCVGLAVRSKTGTFDAHPSWFDHSSIGIPPTPIVLGAWQLAACISDLNVISS